jgi:hypothetical protein
LDGWEKSISARGMFSLVHIYRFVIEWLPPIAQGRSVESVVTTIGLTAGSIRAPR